MNRIWKTLRNNRIWCVLLCAGLLFAGLMVNGEPSLAYFTSQDEVVNQAHGATLAIKLFEPQWYATGMELAKTMEPGITIPKDPYVYNASEVPVYVRMQVKIYRQDENGQVLLDDDGSEVEVEDAQKEAILGIIYCRVKETSEDKEDSEETTTESTDEITTETTVEITADATAETILVHLLQKASVSGKEESEEEDSENQNADAQASETQDSAENQEQTQTAQWTSGNPNFVYKDGWFYYGTEVDGTLSCKALGPGEATPTLFDQLEIPVLKKEYNGLLDQPFVIRVVAEAVTKEQIETEWNGGT